MDNKKNEEKAEEKFEFCTECGEKKPVQKTTSEENSVEKDSLKKEPVKDDLVDNDSEEKDSTKEDLADSNSEEKYSAKEDSADSNSEEKDSAKGDSDDRDSQEKDSAKGDLAEKGSKEKRSTEVESVESHSSESNSDEEAAEPSKKKPWFILGTIAIVVLIIVLSVVNRRNLEADVDADYEYEEALEEQAEEPVVEGVYIPEGALYNDYIVIRQHIELGLSEFEMPQITDEDVERIIEMELGEETVSVEVTDRPAQEGDLVTIDFAGSVDGEYFEGGTSEGFEIVLGSGMFIGPYGDYEGFEEQIIGHNLDENFDIEVQFPTDYQPDLAGEVATFNITLHAITELITPEFTDEWVQERDTEATTVEEYRQEVRDGLYETSRLNVLFIQQNEVFEALMEHVEVIELPQWAIEEEAELLQSLYRSMAVAEGIAFEDFLNQLMGGMDEMAFNQEVLRVAQESAPRLLAILLIMESENLEMTPEDKTERIEELARVGGMESGQEYIDTFGEMFVNSTVRNLRVAEFLIEHSVTITE